MKTVALVEVPLLDGDPASIADSAKGTPVLMANLASSVATFPKKLMAALLTTAAAIGWTGWSFTHDLTINQSMLVTVLAAALLLACLGAWVAVSRALFVYHAKYLEGMSLVDANAKLVQERNLLHAVVDHLPDCIYAKDCEGRFILNNMTHARDLGMESPAEMLGKSDFDFFPRELADGYFTDEQKIINTGVPVINQEQFKSKPGDAKNQKRWSFSSKVVLRDGQGKVLGTVGVTRDIHEFKITQEALRNSEEKLRLSAAQLERSNRELQDFAYVASHDLQEPLRKIVVFSERLREKSNAALGAESCDYLDRMQKAASRMQNLINDLLTFSRVTTKARPFKKVCLTRVAHEVIEDLEGRMEQVKGVVQMGTLPTIDAEPLQLRQLLQNLIGNALKFRRPDETPVVTVAAELISGYVSQADPRASAQLLCRITVKDNGIGFDEKYLDRIFNVFQRLHNRNEYEGTGMGLAIAKKIVLYHGGDITARSRPGAGTTFIVTLPVNHPKPQSTPEY